MWCVACLCGKLRFSSDRPQEGKCLRFEKVKRLGIDKLQYSVWMLQNLAVNTNFSASKIQFSVRITYSSTIDRYRTSFRFICKASLK